MRKFESDPIKYTKNMVCAELRADGNNIAQRLNDIYFTKGKRFEEQLTEMEKVSSILFPIHFFYCAVVIEVVGLLIMSFIAYNLFFLFRCSPTPYFLSLFKMLLICLVDTANNLYITTNWDI